jgi:hypothetical protein
VDDLRLKRNPDVAWRRVEGEAVLVDLKTSRIYTLNPTGTRLWELLGEGHNSADIEATLLGEFDVAAADLHREVDRLLGELTEAGLIE